jgi:hypothetical protein
VGATGSALALLGTGTPARFDRSQHLACPGSQQDYDRLCKSAQFFLPVGSEADVFSAKFRKEGFISLRGPASGGVVCTRQIRWPGGALRINADAHEGELRVRVSDPLRKPLTGYNYEDGAPFTGDSVSHEVTWGDRSLEALKGQAIRIEFFLKNADLYTFRAESKA